MYESRRVLQGANHFIAGVEVREAADDCRPEALHRDSGVALGPGTSIISYNTLHLPPNDFKTEIAPCWVLASRVGIKLQGVTIHSSMIRLFPASADERGTRYSFNY